MKKIINTDSKNTANKKMSFINWHLIIIILLPLIVYLKVVNYDFSDQDDNVIVRGVTGKIVNISKLDEAFKRDAFLENTPGTFYRPVQTVTYAIDSFVSGVNPWMYHLSNLIIHIATCIALYFFLKFFNFKALTAFLLTLIFSVHPLLTAAVAWIPSRGDLLIGLLGILLFMSFGKYFSVNEKSRNKMKYVYFTLHTIFFFLIVFTKESTVLFPVLLLFYYFFILRVSNQIENKKFEINKLVPFFVVWILIPVIFFYARKLVITGVVFSNSFGFVPFYRNLPALPILLGKSFIPIYLSTLPLFNITSIIIGIIVFIALVFLIVPVIKNKQKYSNEKRNIVLMGFGWFFLFTIPPMFYRVDLAEYFFTYFEHRAYLPIIGLIIMSAFFFDILLSRYKTKNITYISILILVVFTFLAYEHCDDYKNSFSFFSSGINNFPNNAGAYLHRGVMYYGIQDYDNALNDFNKVIEIRKHPLAYYYRGLIENYRGQTSSAETDFTKSLSLDSTYTLAYVYRSSSRFILKKYDEALQDLYKAEKFDPLNSEVQNDIGFVFSSTNRYNESIPYFTKAISLNPSYSDAYYNRGNAKLNLKDSTGACADWSQSQKLGNSQAKDMLDKYCR